MAKPNTMFPGLPDYTGPKSGTFGFVHHEVLFEPSYDIMERVKFIKANKAANEIETRLRHHLIYLPPSLFSAKYNAALAKCYAALAKYGAAWAKCDKSVILAYIREHIPNCAWNGKTLVFPK